MTKFLLGLIVGCLVGVASTLLYYHSNQELALQQLPGFLQYYGDSYYEYEGEWKHFEDSETGIAFDYPASLGIARLTKWRAWGQQQNEYPDELQFNRYSIDFYDNANRRSLFIEVVGDNFTYPTEASAASFLAYYCRQHECLKLKLPNGINAEYSGQLSYFESPVNGVVLKRNGYTVVVISAGGAQYYMNDILKTLEISPLE